MAIDHSYENIKKKYHERLQTSLSKSSDFFQLVDRGHHQADAMPSFFPDSKTSIIGLSNEESFVSEIFCKGGKSVQ